MSEPLLFALEVALRILAVLVIGIVLGYITIAIRSLFNE